MPTIPTGRLERELRALYLRWVSGLNVDSTDITGEIASFQRRSEALIAKLGGDVARLGALADFPAPRLLELSPHAGTIYNAMQQAAIQASISAGLNSRAAAQAMFRAGMDQSYRRLERLARTETVRAYWKNAWDSVADLPALVMVWGSEDGPRTCAWCRERDGLVIEDSNLRDHPNGRCTPIPTLRSRVEYRGSVRGDGEIYQDPDWDKKPKGITKNAVTEQSEVNSLEALDDYRVNSFSMNDSLRSRGPVTDEIRALDSLIRRSRLEEPAMVRRILSGGAAEQALKVAQSGKPYRDSAFISTQRISHGTTADAVADYANMGGEIVQIMFQVGDNTPALDVASLLSGAEAFYDEGEILLPRNITLLPGKPRKGTDGIWYILMKIK